MRTIRPILTALLLLVGCPGRTVPAEGREVTLTMTDGRVPEGELLSVRAGTFVISTRTGLRNNELRDHPEFLLELRSENVKGMKLEGSSHVLLGMGIGVAAGAAAVSPLDITLLFP